MHESILCMQIGEYKIVSQLHGQATNHKKVLSLNGDKDGKR